MTFEDFDSDVEEAKQKYPNLSEKIIIKWMKVSYQLQGIEI